MQPMRLMRMRIFLLLGLIALEITSVQGQVTVSGSTSPDGKIALSCRWNTSTDKDTQSELCFYNLSSQLPMSENLVPEQPIHVGDAESVDRNDRWLLLDNIVNDVKSADSGSRIGLALEYFVAWSPDSRWVSVEGGAHKFWHVVVFHVEDGHFRRVNLPPASAFSDHFHAYEADLHIQSSGVEAAIRKISPRDYDVPQSCWLGNGIFAIHARQYLLRDADYGKMENQMFYYLIDCRMSPPTILGFGR